MLVKLWRRRPVGAMQWLRIVKTFQDDRLWSERLGEELAGKSCYLADIIAFDRRARAHADQPAIVAPDVFLEATNEAGHFDAACAAVGMHFIQNEVAHLLVAKDALILAAHQQQ